MVDIKIIIGLKRIKYYKRLRWVAVFLCVCTVALYPFSRFLRIKMLTGDNFKFIEEEPFFFSWFILVGAVFFAFWVFLLIVRHMRCPNCHERFHVGQNAFLGNCGYNDAIQKCANCGMDLNGTYPEENRGQYDRPEDKGK